MSDVLSLYLSVEALWRQAEGKVNLSKQKQRADALFNIKIAEEQTKRKNKTIKAASDMAEPTGGSNGTSPVSYCKTDQTLINKI